MHPLTAFTLAWRNIAARPGRSMGAMAGLALGIAMYVALTTLSQGYTRLVGQPLAQLKSDAVVQKPGPPNKGQAAPGISLPPGNFTLSPREVARITGLDAARPASLALILWERSPAGFMVVLGFDPQGPHQGAASVQDWLAQGRPLREGGDILLEKHFAKMHRKKVGEVWRVGGRPFTICGIVELKAGGALAAGNGFITLEAARSLAGLPPGTANLVFLRLKPGVEIEAAAKELSLVLPGAIMTSADSIGKMMKGFSLISGNFTSLLGALALAFTGLLYLRLVKGVLQERFNEIGIMKTLGWRRRDVSAALLAESLVLGVAGAALGLAVGWLAAWGVGELGIGASLPWNLNPLPAGVGPRSPAAGGPAISLPVAFSWLAGGTSLIFALTLSALMGWWATRRMFKSTVLSSLSEL